MRIEKLEPATSQNQKSFYNKCFIKTSNGVSTLVSYTTEVAEYIHSTNEIKVFGTYSRTTRRHINAFLDKYGFDMCSKKEIEEYYLSNNRPKN